MNVDAKYFRFNKKINQNLTLNEAINKFVLFVLSLILLLLFNGLCEFLYCLYLFFTSLHFLFIEDTSDQYNALAFTRLELYHMALHVIFSEYWMQSHDFLPNAAPTGASMGLYGEKV